MRGQPVRVSSTGTELFRSGFYGVSSNVHLGPSAIECHSERSRRIYVRQAPRPDPSDPDPSTSLRMTWGRLGMTWEQFRMTWGRLGMTWGRGDFIAKPRDDIPGGSQVQDEAHGEQFRMTGSGTRGQFRVPGDHTALHGMSGATAVFIWGCWE